MELRDWIIVAGVLAALPAWIVGVRHQWSRKPGSTARMLKACAVFAAIVLVTIFATFLAA
jgi:glucan phosphoethanolaminetransferase (alkaline phosphatase superfamily)